MTDGGADCGASRRRPASCSRCSVFIRPTAAALRTTLFLAVHFLAAARLAAQAPVVPLDTVRVEVGSRASAALPTLTRAVEVIPARTLRELPVRSVAEALNWAMSVDLMPRSPAQHDVALRGSTFEQVLVLVDGVRMNDPQTGHFSLDTAVPLAQVERIEILRGVASALYGSQAMGGVVNIVTRRGDEAHASARAERGSFGTASAGAGARLPLGPARLDAAAELQRSDGHRDGTDYRVVQGRLAADLPLGGRALRLDVARAARDFGADGFYAPFPSYEETRTTALALGWLAPAAAASGLDVRATFRQHDDDFVLRRQDPGFYRNLHTSTQAGAEVIGRAGLAGGLRLAGGAEGYRDRLESTNLGDRAEDRAAGYAELAKVRGGAMLNAGLRVDWHSEFGGFLAPALAGAWWPLPALRLRASAGRAFRAPTWTERFYEDPNNRGTPDLAPERAWSAELGGDVRLGHALRVGLTAWLREADQLIDWARPLGSDEPWRTRNVGRATFRGVEAEASALLLGARWTLQLAELGFRSGDAAGFTSKYALRPLTRTASLGAARELPLGLDASVRTRYSRRAGTEPPAARGTCRLDARESFLEVDGRIARRWRRARTYLDLRNATDEPGCDITARPAAGRAVAVGLEWGW